MPPVSLSPFGQRIVRTLRNRGYDITLNRCGPDTRITLYDPATRRETFVGYGPSEEAITLQSLARDHRIDAGTVDHDDHHHDAGEPVATRELVAAE